MSLLRMLGKKQIEIASQWLNSGATFGAAAGVGVLYFTDWRVFVTYIPFYNTKFAGEEEATT